MLLYSSKASKLSACRNRKPRYNFPVTKIAGIPKKMLLFITETDIICRTFIRRLIADLLGLILQIYLENRNRLKTCLCKQVRKAKMSPHYCHSDHSLGEPLFVRHSLGLANTTSLSFIHTAYLKANKTSTVARKKKSEHRNCVYTIGLR